MEVLQQAIKWKSKGGVLKAYIAYENGIEQEIVWCAQPGSQRAFLKSRTFEVLYGGTRGGGKTDSLLMDFAQHVGRGYGVEWRGVIFRRTYPELGDVIEKSKKWFNRMFVGASYNEGKNFWEFRDGERLYFRHFKKEADYWSYHGHAYPFIGWEELTTWPDDKGYRKMMSCCRSTMPGIPRKYRATTNPYGVGHNWVKARFRLPLQGNHLVGPLIDNAYDDEGILEPPRRAVLGLLDENKILLSVDPFYIQKIHAAARNKAERRAWVYGDWDIVAGGMLDDVWNKRIHAVPNFPAQVIPKTWRIDRSYDHGQSAPFSVGWWAISNGEPIEWEGRTYGAIRGDMFRIFEWYGWNGKPNEGVRMLSKDIASGILEREKDWGLGARVKSGPADSSIFDETEPDKSIAGDMSSMGVTWQHADKSPGSRKHGWEQIRELLEGAVPHEDGFREDKGLFICERCAQFIRTMPVLPRDDTDLDDVDTNAEDHIADEVRYRVRWKPKVITQRDF